MKYAIVVKTNVFKSQGRTTVRTAFKNRSVDNMFPREDWNSNSQNLSSIQFMFGGSRIAMQLFSQKQKRKVNMH